MASSLPHAPPRQRNEIISLAVYEQHDADIPTNLGAVTSSRTNSTRTASTHEKDGELEKDIDIDIEKALPSSSNASIKDDVAVTTTAESKEEDAGEEEDSNVVTWDGPDDPQNPMNWSSFRKWGTVAIVSGITLLTPMGSSMFAPGVPDVMRDFHSDNEALSGFIVSVYVLGFAFGPLVIAPLSEMFGRLPLYHTCNILFIIFTLACGASTNISMFIVFRFLQGTFGASPITLGGGTIADLISREQRGTAMAVWMMGPTFGPVAGPIAGGFITHAKGWRWNFWILSIIASGFTIASFILMRETYAPAILSRKARHLRKSTGNPHLRSALASPLSPRDLFLLSIIRPTKMLLFSPIVQTISLYLAITYAYLYIMFTTFTSVFTTTYGFSRAISGLSFLGLGIGCILAQLYGTWKSNKLYMSALANGTATPETRLPMMRLGAICIPIGLLIYGWTAQYHVHWAVPIAATGVVGAGIMLTFMPASTYLVEVFTSHAASAMAASTVLRSLFAAVLPLAGGKMYEKLGLGWGNTLLAGVAVVFVPVPWVFLRYGGWIRTRWVVKL